MNTSKKLLSIVGILFPILPLYVWGIWINVFLSHADIPDFEKANIFLNSLPDVLQSTSLLNFISEGFPIVAVVCGIISLRGVRGFFKILSVGAITLGCCCHY
jgi:hypothetical protein